MKASLGLVTLVAMMIVTGAARSVLGQDPAPSSKLYIYSGTLQSIDKQARTIMVENSAVSQRFVVPTDARIAVKDKPKAGLEDLMLGDRIQVKYTVDDGRNVAHQISPLGSENP